MSEGKDGKPKSESQTSNVESGKPKAESRLSKVKIGKSNVKLTKPNVESQKSKFKIGKSKVESTKPKVESQEARIKNQNRKVKSWMSKVINRKPNGESQNVKLVESKLSVSVKSVCFTDFSDHYHDQLRLWSHQSKLGTKIPLMTTVVYHYWQLSCIFILFTVRRISIPPQIDAKIYDKVKTFLLFLGYNRSRHTLLASLLDAHPNIIIANDFNILQEWIQNPVLSLRQKYYIYEILLAKSRYDVTVGVRSRPVDNKPVKYHYNVKNQWQGRYNRTIQVRLRKK